jgi:hypothetical protein
MHLSLRLLHDPRALLQEKISLVIAQVFNFALQIKSSLVVVWLSFGRFGRGPA